MSAQDSHYPQLTEPAPPAGDTHSVSPMGAAAVETATVETATGQKAAVETARIGAELRQVRERVGWKLSEVAAELRIREAYLDAIERGELTALPGPAYQVGFVRSYARTLGLDGDEILRRFRAEGLGAVRTPELSFLAPVPDRAVPSGAIVLLGAVLLLIGYGLWYLHTDNDRTLAAAVPPVPAQLAPLTVPPAPARPATAQTAPAKATGASLAANPPSATPSAPSTPGAMAGAAGTNTAVHSAPGTGQPQVAASATSPATTGVSTPGLSTPGKSIRATADSWVEVKDASGNILFSRLMHSGDSWPVPDLPGLTLTAGNAGGTEITNGGVAGQPLGAAGAVVRGYALTPSAAANTTTPAVSSPALPAPPSAEQSPAKGIN